MSGKKYIMFIDETGTSDINDHTQPFTLTGAIFEYKYAIIENAVSCKLKDEISRFKMKCFGTSDIHLHLNDISRGIGQFASTDIKSRKSFFRELPSFLESLDFYIVSVTVDKDKLLEYYSPSKEPYIVAFTHILQNFYSFLNNTNAESARIVIESRDDASNLLVQKTFFDVFNNGTEHLHIDETLKKRMKGFVMASKYHTIYQSGLEIADLICNPLSRVRRGLIEANPKCMRPGEYGKKNKIFASIKHKIYTATDLNDLRNWGFKKVPVLKHKRIWANDPR